MAENFSRLIEPLLLTPDDIDEILGNETGEKKDAHSKGKVEHLPKLLFDRSLSLPRANYSTTQKKFEVAAEENLLKKDLQETSCSIPGNPKSTFLMVFSPDGSKVASSHGDHNINVTDLRTKKCITTLTGHPRTPWCIAFHPHRNDILASGCLGGQVRVWDLHGGSEMWSVMTSEVTTVIASLAFHPSERLLVIATNSTLYFWDWNIPQPFAKCSTASEKQKLRYVSFDPLGNWLLTGISNAPGSSASLAASSSIGSTASGLPMPGSLTSFQRAERLEQERERNLQDRYQILLDQYERLRVRYQELRHRAAELELSAGPGQPANADPTTEPTRGATHPTADASLLTGSSTDQFWRTLMNAAENLRELSNIGRSLNNPSTSTAAGPSRAARPSLDQDARIRIQLLSRHIEDMQRICLSHIEVTRHRRQVYRLQQIRRILEDLREQIRYLQDCVRDSLDLVTRLRPTPHSPPAGPSGATSSTNNEHPSPSASSDPPAAQPTSAPQRTAVRPRVFSPVQYRRFARFLMGRYRRTGTNQEQSQRSYGRDPRLSLRWRLRTGIRSPPAATQTDPQPSTSRDSSDLEDDDLSAEPSLERDVVQTNQNASTTGGGGPSSGGSLGFRRVRFAGPSRRTLGAPRSNTLLHVRNHAIQRRKPSILSRSLQARARPSASPSSPSPSPSSAASQASSHEASRRLADQSLRPLMERLESHFRLQRQTLGILAQLNDSAGNGSSLGPSESSAPGPSGSTNAPGASEGNSPPRTWAGNVFRNVRHWRSRRETLERGRSLDSRTPGSGVEPYLIPRRPGSFFPPPYRGLRAPDDDDSSDTDTDMTSENPTSYEWRQPSPIRSPRGVEQRMRLLWREYLSQVVNAQASAPAESQNGPENPGGEAGDATADQERSRYRMWLSTMVESLTSFFSQHGINSSEAEPGAPPPVTTPPRPPPLRHSYARAPAAPAAAAEDDGPRRPSGEQPPWRIFQRVGIDLGSGASPGEHFIGQQRWNMRRNAESQVSLSSHLTYRIQAWDFSAKAGVVPDICDPSANVVVRESKIHNDASVDVSVDGRFLVTLIPCASLSGACVSVHSLEPSRLGQCLAQVNVDQFVVSVSISPTCRHLLLGLASSRAVTVIARDPSLPTLWAKVFEIPVRLFDARPKTEAPDAANDPRPGSWRTARGPTRSPGARRISSLPVAREILQTSEVGVTSLNCIRWIPTAGQGLVLGTNKGHLKVIS